MKNKIALIFGGRSVEHEVSVITGIQAFNNIDKDKYDVICVYLSKNNNMYIGKDIENIEAYKDIDKLISNSQQVLMINADDKVKLINYPFKRLGKNNSIDIDIVFPAVHGTNVEDGVLQGYLKTIGVPFVGCDVTASAVGMDKFIMKAILKEYDVPVLDSVLYTTSDYANLDNLVEDVETKIDYPAIIKPLNLGSSVGIGIAKNKDELINCVDDAFKYSSKIIVERAILNLREINCSVLGDENEAIASECEEPMHSEEILSYEDKYVNNAKEGKSGGMASVSRQIPADISKDMREKIRDLSVKSFKALSCNGVARIDFMIDQDSDKLYFNEINTIPGSLAFYLWEPVGIKYSELLDRMIELALKRKREQDQLSFSFDTNILNNANFGSKKNGKL